MGMTVFVVESSRHFEFGDVGPSEMPRVARFVHSVAEAAQQRVYVVALEVEGREFGELIEPESMPSFPIREGGRELPRGRIRFGGEVVVWATKDSEATAALIGEHLKDYWVNWAVAVDSRGARKVAEDARTHSDRLWTFEETAGPERALAMVKHDPGRDFSGRVAPHLWEVARALLLEMPGARDHHYDDPSGGGR